MGEDWVRKKNDGWQRHRQASVAGLRVEDLFSRVPAVRSFQVTADVVGHVRVGQPLLGHRRPSGMIAFCAGDNDVAVVSNADARLLPDGPLVARVVEVDDELAILGVVRPEAL